MDDIDRKKSAIEEIITKYGYIVETHRITTADGYILKAFRIPHRINEEIVKQNKKVVWLQHGFLGSAMDWLLLNEKSLAFLLSDSGYDVWLGNARGNRHSRRHVSIDPNTGPFWDFSFHEMGKYDVPAVIDYALDATGAEDLFWIGHSMGSCMFFIAMIENPEYNKKVKFMVAAAPAVFVHNMKSPLALLAPFADILTWEFWMKEFLPGPALPNWLPDWVVNIVGKTFADPLTLFNGGNKMHIKENASLFLSQFPAGSSTKTLLHYAQIVSFKNFEKFNYGETKNVEVYGTLVPPDYDLSLISVPVAMFYGDEDFIVNPKDVIMLASKITNLVSNNRVERDDFDHMDFMVAPDAPTILYGKIISLIQSY